MIEEDYVSFEVAKLLKEKGFNKICLRTYFDYGEMSRIYDEDEGVYNENLLPSIIAAPTHQMAMKWLREKHGIHIVIHPSSGVYYGKYCLSIYVQRVKNKDFHLTYQTHEDTYEKAVEEGISYSLISLI